MILVDQIKRAADFFSQKNLEQTPVAYSPAPGDIQLASDLALLVIDVQKEFCDPQGYRGNDETQEVSQRIKSLVPEFRKAGIPVYAVYFSCKPKKTNDIDFYEFAPAQNDILVAKNDDSAFKGSDIKAILQQHGHKTLLACGFNLNACVYETVMDAVSEGFGVRLLRDMTGNDNNNDSSNAEKYLKEMEEKGIAITCSDEELRAIKAPNTAAAPNMTPAPLPKIWP